ncbi:hypothetical protein SAMD00019534_019350 [Acytostelium subglobosum LB1]|uniref:hypothetical protein n=1 Tax=Acytostelium subglobosum LB1 TaxID=1410327 RepID=UPI000644BAB0|nr:hypothetical protein SAMD00019534_019350 [Acytostelium subglobosum LB1]GAM18760.1 hypothetical protein SAMD00019534_019350 [Acytostelium subglobosum LB1]|eukprot:XP_012757980.1 hypothetical protein SAMD00019534_019350 [Acytostelium subglobosum LB1]
MTSTPLHGYDHGSSAKNKQKDDLENQLNKLTEHLADERGVTVGHLVQSGEDGKVWGDRMIEPPHVRS